MDGKISRPWGMVGLQPARPAGPPDRIFSDLYRPLYRPLYPLILFTKTRHWSFLVKAFAAMTSRCSKAFTKTSHWSFLVKAFEAMTSHGGDVAENV